MVQGRVRTGDNLRPGGEEKAVRQQRLRVLICDTDAEILINLEQMLENAGFDTTTIWEAMDRGRLLERNPFDLLIVGDHPPHMDAEVISRELRDAEVILRELREKHPRTPVVLCLVQRRLDESEMERFRSAGATAVISRQDQNSIFAQVGFYLRPANSGLRNAG